MHWVGSYVLGKMWRASGTGCSDCLHLPTCGLHPGLSLASHRSQLCCKTLPSNPPQSCFRHRLLQNSFCIRWNSASRSPRIADRSINQSNNKGNLYRHLRMTEKKHKATLHYIAGEKVHNNSIKIIFLELVIHRALPWKVINMQTVHCFYFLVFCVPSRISLKI